jgi:hypothetical protein
MSKSKTTPAATAPAAAPQTQQEETTALVQTQAAEVGFPIDFSADAGMGATFTGSDLAIPFLTILQKNSPQVDEDNGKHVEGAKPGMIYNTVTGELFDGKNTGIVVVPAGYQKKFVEWIHRDDGGGFVAQHDPESDAVRACKPNEKGKLETADGHQMVETAYHYVTLIDSNGNPQWAVISMSSSQLKKSRKWNTLVAGVTMTVNGKTFKPPIFSHKYALRTVVEQKDQNTWYGWDIGNAGVVGVRAVYESAKSYCQALTDGSIRVTAPPSDESDAEGKGPTPF